MVPTTQNTIQYHIIDMQGQYIIQYTLYLHFLTVSQQDHWNLNTVLKLYTKGIYIMRHSTVCSLFNGSFSDIK